MQRITTTVFNNGDSIPEAKTIEEFNVVFQDVKTPYFIRLNGCVFYNKYAVDDPRGIIPPGHRFPEISDVLDIPKNGYILETDLHHSTGTRRALAGCWMQENTMIGTYKNVPSAQAIVVDYDGNVKAMAMPQNWGFEVYVLPNEINETVQIQGQPVQVILVPTGRRDGTYFFKDVPGVEAVDIIRALRDQAVDTWLLMYPKDQREKALYFALTINHI